MSVVAGILGGGPFAEILAGILGDDFAAFLDPRARYLNAFYGATPTKRSGRRTKRQMDTICGAMIHILQEHQPMTVRQVFYQLSTQGWIDKTEAEYKSVVCRKLVELRKTRVIPFDWIADNTRWMRKPVSHDSMEAALEETAACYRRNHWSDLDVYVEVWLEKEALAGVLCDETSTWDVPLMVTRGYPSLSFLHSAAETIAGCDKEVFLYYFGDHDPSGVDISRHVEESILELAPDADVNFERVAVNENQIELWGLPTRPTKKSDSRAKNFHGDSVEVDAISPDDLRAMAQTCITAHIDSAEWEQLQQTEAAEKETLKHFIEGFAS